MSGERNRKSSFNLRLYIWDLYWWIVSLANFGFRIQGGLLANARNEYKPFKASTYGRSSLSELNRSEPEIEPEHSKRRRLTTLIRGRSHCKNTIKVLCKSSKSTLCTSNITKLTNIMTYSLCLWVVKVTSLGNFTPDLGSRPSLAIKACKKPFLPKYQLNPTKRGTSLRVSNCGSSVNH